MVKDYRFKDIEKYLKKDSDIGEDILDAFESLTDAAIIFSPIIFGPQFIPILDLLDVKDRLFNLGHKVYNFIAQKIELDYIDRMEQIRAAYALICYTAYFDVLQDALPSNVRRKIKLKLDTKEELVEEAIESNNALLPLSPPPDIHCNIYYADHLTSFSDIKEQLLATYERITKNLIKVISESSVYNEDQEKEKQELEELKAELDNLPQKAIAVYEAQYLNLADQFNDFALFAQLKHFEGIHHAIEKNGNALDLLVSTTKRIDVGLSNLNSIVNSIATNYSAIQAQDIVDDLKETYIATIEEPIIDDKEIKSDTETMSLKFPRIVDAFIPQSYKCLSYQQKSTKLEDASVWKQLPIQRDLDKFFVEYLYSPDSIDYPLVILGQPGSGKSLLTKVLSAQLMSSSYTVIRIPLREVNADDGIDVLVEDQIKKVTNRPLSTQGYGGFAKQFNEKPLIIILDGYDELLQAKGDVFSGYLEKVRTFQQDQKTLKRPVRIIVTSRITLIDKARIPVNSTVLRLMEFDSQQQQAWINIWNNINADYFASSSIKPFNLPSKEKGKKNSIIELAEQPLLLLMLALYDSEANELAKTSDIQRTELYDNLLRRFIRRERRRYVQGFVDKTPEEQEVIIDQEMNRLGVVAIGMYNRKGVVIRSRQLEKDLDLFNAHRIDGSPEAHTLKESESVLGGFFFIHKSTAQDNDAHSDASESAYEFLHNTFGEFLTADFILRNTINEVKDILVDRIFKSSGLMNKLSNPDSLNSGWFYCLMFVPLYSRPVVIEMLREHASRALQRALKLYRISIDITRDNFIDNLNFLVKNQLKMILNTRNSPSVMRGDILLDQDIPLLGYLATYSLNLVILACALSTNGFEFNENDYIQSETSVLESRPWEKLTSLWKAWFSPADLMGLSVILKAKRISDTVISIKCNEKFEATRYEQSIDILLCVSFTLADNLLVGLSGLQSPRFGEITKMNNKKICGMLKGENPDLYFSYLINLLRKEVNCLSIENGKRVEYTINYRRINEIIETIIYDDKINEINDNALLTIFEVLEYCLMRNIVFLSTRKHLTEELSHILGKSRISYKKTPKNPEAISAVRLLRLCIKNNGFLMLDKHGEIYSVHGYIGGEWSEEIDRLIRYTSRYTQNDVYFLHDYQRNNTCEMPFGDIINRLPLMKEEQEQILGHLFAPDNMDVLLETNPEWWSYTILNFLKEGVVRPNEVNHITHSFLQGFLRILESVGLGYLELSTIINTISIARYTNETWFLKEIKNWLRYHILGKHSRFFLSILQLYPNFVADLIDVMPEIFDHAYLDIFDAFFQERKFQFYNSANLLDYIRLFRHFYQMFSDESKSKERIPRELRTFDRMIHELNAFEKINFSQLTISQIEDLAWYANFTDDSHLSTEIKRYLARKFDF